MASSIERRWGSARRAGMTVLGKVAVPKPVNLPSQRLENHGLDPNVEIVPKGTLSWGNRSAAAAVNAWGSSSLASPNTDGSAGSPTRLNTRPSSGGSGARPSTAGSDKSHEPASSNVWGPSSRPSSASGALPSSHSALVSSRPRSAETRLGSSHLSRFADASTENSGAWGGLPTSERPGTASPKISGFTMSSGDFPVLGSDKSAESHTQGHSSQGRPASSGAATPRERLETSSTEDGGSIDAHAERGTVNTWKRDSPPFQGGAPPTMDKWQRDSQQAQPYPNMNMPNHQFDPWHASNPRIRTPSEGGWYRGGLPVGPYGPTGPPGGYPFDPSAYFHSQMGARPASYPQPVLRPGAGPTGYPKNGESFRPCMSDSYIVPSCPVIPIRPGVFPGPVPFDGYYGPPHAGFCKTDECDVSVMGMAAGSGVYSRYPNQQFHPDPSHFHARPGSYGPNLVVSKEHMESGLGHNTHQGPYKVLLKQHDSWLEKNAEEKRGHSVATGMRGFDRPTGEKDWGADASNDEPMDFSKPAFCEDTSFQPTRDHGRVSSVSVVRNEPEEANSAITVDSSPKIPESAAIPADHSQQLPAEKKGANLIEKIEGLNTKARAFDGKDEKTKKFKTVNAKPDQSNRDVGVSSLAEKSSTSDILMQSSNKTVAFTGDKSSKLPSIEIVEPKRLEPQTSGANLLDNSEVREKAHFNNQKRGHGIQNRVDYRAKGRFNTEESEEWRRKPAGADSSSVSVGSSGDRPIVHVQDHRGASQEGHEMHGKDLSSKLGGDPLMASSDSNDLKAQRARMREIAALRTKQLQKEEEERVREQKAKALAKLEELNRRTLAESSSHFNSDQSQQHKPADTSRSNAPLEIDTSSLGEIPGLANSMPGTSQSVGNSGSLGTVSQASNKGIDRLGESTDFLIPLGASINASQRSAFKPAESPALLPLNTAAGLDPAFEKTAPQASDAGVSGQKPMSQKRKQTISQGKNLGDQQTTTGGIKVPVKAVVGTNASSDHSIIANSTSNADDNSVALKKKNNRNAKNKHKPDEPLVGTDVSQGDTFIMKVSVENGKPQASEPEPETSSVQAQISKDVVEDGDSQNAVPFMDQGLPQISEDAHGRANQWKAQPVRWTTRSTQVNRPADKFHGSEAVVWAPVRPLGKCTPSEETGQNINDEGDNISSTKNLKNKRAEMERYVPKPVAKELSQQGNSQQPVALPLPQVASDQVTFGKAEGPQSTEISVLHGLNAEKVGVAVETRNGESKYNNRHGKTQASWRQRASVKPSHSTEMSHEGRLPSSEQSKAVQKDRIPDITSPKRQTESSDSWTNSSAPMEPVAGASFAKDHGPSEKAGKPTQKVRRGGGHNHTPMDKDLQSGVANKMDSKFVAFESIESDGRNISRSESQRGGEHMVSHWQPKSQAYPAHSRQGSNVNDKVMGGQRNEAHVRVPEKEFPSQGTVSVPQRADMGSHTPVQPYQSEIHKPNVTETANPRFHETRKVRGQKEQPSATSGVDHALEKSDWQHEQPVPLGQRQHQNGRFHRGPEAHFGGGHGQWQETIKKTMPGNGDRRSHNSHFEYQPIGFQKPDDPIQHNSSIGDEVQGSSQGGRGSRYRERGHNHGRRGGGHFYGRNGGGDSRIPVSYKGE